MLKNYINNIIDAFSFLTVIRIDRKSFNPAGTVNSFAYVGLAIGGGLALISVLLHKSNVSAAIMVIYLSFITGFLHIDGLADTFDALFSGRDKEKKLEIMKDSRIGTMGAVAIVLSILGKFSALGEIDSVYLLIAIPSLSRFTMGILAGKLPYLRDNGTGKGFFAPIGWLFWLQIIPAQILLYLSGMMNFLIINTVFVLMTVIITYWYRKTMGGATGDMLGASCELTETALFLSVVCYV